MNAVLRDRLDPANDVAELRIPPHSVEAEQSVLGGLLLDNTAWHRVGDLVAGDFYRYEHRLIFAAIGALVNATKPADVITVFEQLQSLGKADECGGLVYLAALAQSVPSAANMRRYAEIVRERAVARFVADGVASPAGRTVAQILEAALRRLDAAAPSTGLDYVSAADLDDADQAFDDEIVEGVLCRSTMAVFYGDSNSGKTFAAVDLAASVALGSQWLGHRCEAGLVIYLASEAPASVELRLRAYQRHHGVRVPGLVIVRSPINLFDGHADVAAVLKLVRDVEDKLGMKVSLIVGDTLARIAAGANENTSEDMGVVITNADRIRSGTGATFLWIAHCGKDAAKGMRGWSGTRAFIDTELECTADDASGQRCLEVTKQRDLGTKGERLGFRLTSLVMGSNQWGTPRTTCVVEATAAPTKTTGKRPSEIAGAITEFLTERGSGCLKGRMVKHFEGRYTSSAVYRELKKMVSDGMLIEAVGVVAMPGKPGGAN